MFRGLAEAHLLAVLVKANPKPRFKSETYKDQEFAATRIAREVKKHRCHEDCCGKPVIHEASPKTHAEPSLLASSLLVNWPLVDAQPVREAGRYRDAPNARNRSRLPRDEQPVRTARPTTKVPLAVGREGTTLLEQLRGNRTGFGFRPPSLTPQKRGLTFDMSGGAKGAKRPLGRPLDGGVRRRHRVQH